MFYKLSIIGMSAKIITLLSLLYSQNTCQVWDGSKLSDPFPVNQGLRQGCPLSPTLFSLYVNDLADSLPGGVVIGNTTLKVLLYADDLVLLSESPEDLQHMINSLHTYCQNWGLKVNLSKSKIVVFRKSPRISSNLKWFYDGSEVQIVNEFKYLGVTLAYNLSFNKHLNERLKASKMAIIANWSHYIHNPKISVSNKMKIFISAAQTIMLYAAPVWGFKECDQPDKLFRFFIKTILKLPNNTPNYAIYLETRQHSQFTKALEFHFNYIIKVLNMSSDRLPKILALETISKNIFWYKEWKQIFLQLGISEPASMDTRVLRITLDHALIALKSEQLNQFKSAASLSTFHDIYPDLDHENPTYFNDNNTTTAISFMFKARTGLLDINARAFKKGTFGICSLCNLDAVENTHHFIGVCPIFNNIRKECFGLTILSIEELHCILNNDCLDKLVNYLCYALKYRYLLETEFS